MTLADTKIGMVCFGFFLGFLIPTLNTAVKQTLRSRNPWRSMFIWMIWGEMLANLGIALIAFLWLNGTIHFSVGLLVFGLLLWVIEVQFLLQIIINRLTLVMSDQMRAAKIKWGVAALMTIVNIAVFCIWIPAKLQVSPLYIRINDIWDRISKIIILIVDAILNWYFIRVVKDRLVDQGLTKYDALVRFNIRIMLISVGIDVLIIGLMSVKNPILYVAFQAPAYLVKLKIEMTMADLIAKVTRAPTHINTVPGMNDTKQNRVLPLNTVDTDPWHRRSLHSRSNSIPASPMAIKMKGDVVHVRQDVDIEVLELRDSMEASPTSTQSVWANSTSSKVNLKS